MDKLVNHLKQCILFKGLTCDELQNLITSINYSISNNCKNCTECQTCIVALEGEICESLGIVIEGKLEVQKHYASGKVVTLAKLDKGKIFGEAIAFSETNIYPATIVSYKGSIILYISKKDIIAMCSSYPKVLNNFMQLLSSKILLLNKKIKELSFETLRQKISNYLLSQYEIQKNLALLLPISRKSLADHLGVQRPSLSRELVNMRADGLIDFNKNLIQIKDLAGIENILN
ncbi:Crp/Fnr family transcriptional regulator [Clostridium sp. CF011]|uniref:Crp/Fnr family transcriptional regulator n=1 Tax=unclassified Clostridium TaxID=2614128 RepID=UPI001C0B7692|nr:MULTISPECIES: Crp/Fnr family transcriptional regulator [unclassified Clostridium]MBU3092565.1 Crp/Fnr family transcriptional regulator [Clostridium sp. CF011]MBW9146234.1 Crp/Fnr family transcriptional regulator [Clostridium sp. CM027]UVE39787.1 Crp/Fnr family transcriptional regulator [Clostridium sp. CM027]WAG68694.1 Crp/Fnr family transcriptional regulator [Clostridium sp. CF011]